MIFGPVARKWWQDLCAGRLTTPQSIYRAALNEVPSVGPRFLPEQMPDDSGPWDVPARLQSPRYFLTGAYLVHGEKADWQHVDVRLMRWAALFVEYARKRNVPLYVHTAYRTDAEQARLKAAGRSKAGPGLSAHNIGEAVDVVHGVLHWDMTPGEWAWVSVLGKAALRRVNATLKAHEKLELVWGGPDGPSDRFKWDPAHWEVSDFRARRRTLVDGAPLHLMPRAILAKYKG